MIWTDFVQTILMIIGALWLMMATAWELFPRVSHTISPRVGIVC